MLRKGSRGNLVITLQNFLGINADGIFGNETEYAVKNFQKQFNLRPDGIVGRETYEQMGILSSDLSENNEVNNDVVIEKYYLPENEYFKSVQKKNWVFLHYTASSENPYRVIDSWASDNRGRIATEFVIGGQSLNGKNKEHDGKILQAFPEGGYGWHLGIGNNSLHRNSIGIEICSMGFLTKGGYWTRLTRNGESKRIFIKKNPDKYYAFNGQEAHKSQVLILNEPFLGHKAWHRFSDKQLAAINDLLQIIGKRDEIDITKGLAPLIRMEGWKAFANRNIPYIERTFGVWSHSNVSNQKLDVFPQPELIELLTTL
jgi:N-acetyl-anhydromuramyl-L-alanine amidase AmpD